jgi:hypothetical protein
LCMYLFQETPRLNTLQPLCRGHMSQTYEIGFTRAWHNILIIYILWYNIGY